MTAVAAPEKRLTDHDLAKAIRARYEPPEWHIEGEVTLNGRRLDLVALNLFSTHRFRIVGFELKVDRGDWLRELSNFQKSEEWVAVVDAFYLVTPPKLVKTDELPEGWGHLELCGSRMMTRRHAAEKPPRVEMPREIACRFLGRLASKLTQRDIDERRALEREIETKVHKANVEQLARSQETERQYIEAMRKDYHALLDALGVRPAAWNSHQQAMRAAGILATLGTTEGLSSRLELGARALEGHLARVREAVAAIKAIEEAPLHA